MDHLDSSMQIGAIPDQSLSPIQASSLVATYPKDSLSFATNSFLGLFFLISYY